MSNKRIADRIMVEKIDIPSGIPDIDPEWVRGAVRRAQRINIDPVADLALRGYGAGDGYDLREYPNVAPPFELAWFEYQRPASMMSLSDVERARVLAGYRTSGAADEKGWTFGHPAFPDRVGCLVTSVRDEDDAGWISYMGFWVADRSAPNIIGPLMIEMRCDAEGRVTKFGVKVDRNCSPGLAKALRIAVANLEMPVLMATSLLHAKNVGLDLEDPLPPKMARAYARRHNGVQRVRFHELHIEPMRKALRNPDGSETRNPTELKKALHLVRGHFKDYRDGRGLFGKLKGLYWWESHAVGTIEAGAVEKEYVVHPERRKGAA